jgi:4-hydroxy-3-methylbut-2-enyl diphosphate reductase IspH
VRSQRLRDMSVSIIEDAGQGKDFGGVRKGDVVILPAFGASVQEMQMLNDREVELVDTTCPWVSKARRLPLASSLCPRMMASSRVPCTASLPSGGDPL